MSEELKPRPANWVGWRNWLAATHENLAKQDRYELFSAHLDEAARQLDDWNSRAPSVTREVKMSEPWTEHDRIWLEPACERPHCRHAERTWCQDNVWAPTGCDECGKQATEFRRTPAKEGT